MSKIIANELYIISRCNCFSKAAIRRFPQLAILNARFSSRDDESRGAMKDFLNNVQASKTSSPSNSLWSKLRSASPEKVEKGVPKTTKPQLYSREPSTSTTNTNTGNSNRIFNPRSKTFNGRKSRPTTSKPGDKDKMKLSIDNDEAVLFDADYFYETVRKGQTLDESEGDDMDRWIADIFIESYKSKDHSVKSIDIAKKVNAMPRSRSTRELLNRLQFPANSAPDDSVAQQLAQEAWMNISKNFYYSDQEKKKIFDGILSYTNNIINKADKFEREVEDGLRSELELIDSMDVRRLKGERFEASIYRRQDVDEIQKEAILAILEDNTDWSVEAVADEDELDFSEDEGNKVSE